jgi:hypothetical protein
MGTINISTGPIELVIDGTSILMQSDPTVTPEFDSLMQFKVSFQTATSRKKAKTELTKALSALAHTPEDAERLVNLDLGVATLQNAAIGYIQEVTAFPTRRQSTSGKP